MSNNYNIAYYCPYCNQTLVYVNKCSNTNRDIYLCKNINCFITALYYIDSLGNIEEYIKNDTYSNIN